MMDTSASMEVETDVREICALLECMGVDSLTAWRYLCFGCLREFASLFGMLHGGALDLRSGWNLLDEIATHHL